MSLKDEVTARITDIDSALIREEELYKEKKRALLAKQATLKKALKHLTPEVDKSFEDVGVELPRRGVRD